MESKRAQLSGVMLLLLAGCATQTVPKALNNLRQHTQFAPIQRFQQKQSVQPPFQAVIPWDYAPGSNNFCWTLQSSSNLVDWVDLPGACVTDPLTAYATNGSGFFRLRGSPFTP